MPPQFLDSSQRSVVVAFRSVALALCLNCRYLSSRSTISYAPLIFSRLSLWSLSKRNQHKMNHDISRLCTEQPCTKIATSTRTTRTKKKKPCHRLIKPYGVRIEDSALRYGNQPLAQTSSRGVNQAHWFLALDLKQLELLSTVRASPLFAVRTRGQGRRPFHRWPGTAAPRQATLSMCILNLGMAVLSTQTASYHLERRPCATETLDCVIRCR